LGAVVVVVAAGRTVVLVVGRPVVVVVVLVGGEVPVVVVAVVVVVTGDGAPVQGAEPTRQPVGRPVPPVTATWKPKPALAPGAKEPSHGALVTLTAPPAVTAEPSHQFTSVAPAGTWNLSCQPLVVEVPTLVMV
jgi:hypothetical protein